MDASALAARDIALPPAPGPQAPPARGDDSHSFQDHLDTQDAAAPTTPDHPRSAGARHVKPTKAQAAPQHDGAQSVQDADGAAAHDDDAEKTPAAAADAPHAETPTHASLVQVLPEPASEAAPQTPQPEQPALKAPQPPHTIAQPSAPVSAQVQTNAAQIDQAVSAPADTAPAQTTAASHKPTKSDGKTAKSAAAAQQAQQPDAQQAAAPQTAPQTPPAPQAAPSTPPVIAANAPNDANAQDEAVIGAVQANGARAKAAAPTPAPSTQPAPSAANTPAADAPKADSAKARATRSNETVATGAAAKTNAAAPDFKDLVRAANAAGAPASSAAPSASVTPQTIAASSASATGLDAARVAAAPVSSQVAREIVRRANGDNTRFELRLDPPELGKIQVQLDMSRDHKVTAVVSAENPHALNELSRGARDLQQALQSAGLDLADDGLTFDLSNSGSGFSQPDQSNTGRNADAPARGPFAQPQTNADTSSTPRARPLSIESWRGARIDVMA